MKDWAALKLDERRAVLEAVRDASGDFLPLLWQAYDGAPDPRWRKRMESALDRLRACDVDFNEVPTTLNFLPWHIEALERFASVEAWQGDRVRRDRARVLLELVNFGNGLALCDGENLLEVEAVRKRAAADVAAAQADAAKARGDLDGERALRAVAQARAANAEALAEERRQAVAELQAVLENRNRRSRAARKSKPKPGPGEMTAADWSRFLASLDKLLAEDAARPAREKVGQASVIEFAVKRHNDNAARKIHASPATVLKRWQRWRTTRKKAR